MKKLNTKNIENKIKKNNRKRSCLSHYVTACRDTSTTTKLTEGFLPCAPSKMFIFCLSLTTANNGDTSFVVKVSTNW